MLYGVLDYRKKKNVSDNLLEIERNGDWEYVRFIIHQRTDSEDDNDKSHSYTGLMIVIPVSELVDVKPAGGDRHWYTLRN